jgi:hypothetical protein
VQEVMTPRLLNLLSLNDLYLVDRHIYYLSPETSSLTVASIMK